MKNKTTRRQFWKKRSKTKWKKMEKKTCGKS